MSKVRKTKNHFAGILVAASIFAVSLPAYAAYEGAVLSEIEINPYHGDSYEIQIKTDKKVPIQKQVTSDNEIVLNLENIKPAKFVNTVYNNISNIDHVIVQPLSNNHVKITLHGNNVSTSKITVSTQGTSLPEDKIALNLADTTQEQTAQQPIQEEQKPSTEKTIKEVVNNSSDSSKINSPQQPVIGEQEAIVLRKPINEFKPVALYNEEDTAIEEESSNLTAETIMTGLKKIFNTNNLDWLLRFSILILLVIGGLKLLKPRNKNIKIDLTEDVRKREIDLLRTITERKGLIGSGLKDNVRPVGIPKKPGYSSVSNYGMKEYQNSQVPPSSSLNTNSPVSRPKMETKQNKSLPNNDLLRQNTQRTLAKEAPTLKSSSKITQQDINTAKVNINSKQFLETMANLYERSGRTDLAYGIKRNIANPK